MPLKLQQAFDPRANSIGFLRWLMAFAVIFAHAGPLAGFYDGHDLGSQISKEQSLGGVAVAGFFFFSGFLITNSRRGKSTVFRYFWRRALRIFPAFWLALLTTAFVLGPIAWNQEAGSMAGYWDADHDSPYTYFVNNMWLVLQQRNIAGMGHSLPLAELGSYDWNGSAWTLMYEFRAYIIIGILGLFGGLANRWIGGAVAMAFIVLNAFQWTGTMNMHAISTLLGNPYNMMFLAPFGLGMLFALWAEHIPIDDRLAFGALTLAYISYATGGWNIWGQYGFLYFLMWFAVRVRGLNNWERFGDFSYGIYIFGWPIMQFAAFFRLQDAGWFVYHLVVIVAVHVLAFISWHAIEKPAMSLKNWTPAPLAKLIAWGRPAVDAVKRRIVNPDFSSANFAKRLRAEAAAASVAAPAATAVAVAAPEPPAAEPALPAPAPAPVSVDVDATEAELGAAIDADALEREAARGSDADDASEPEKSEVPA